MAKKQFVNEWADQGDLAKKSSAFKDVPKDQFVETTSTDPKTGLKSTTRIRTESAATNSVEAPASGEAFASVAPSSDFSTTDDVNPEGTPPTGSSDFSPLQEVEGPEARAERQLAEQSAVAVDLSESFLAARGTFYRVPLRSGNGPGLYAVEGLSQFVTDARKERERNLKRLKFDSRFQSPEQTSSQLEQDDPEEFFRRTYVNSQIDSENARRSDEDRQTAADKGILANTPILIMGIELSQQDIVSPVSCLGNVKIFYTFGQAFGNVMIRGEMLLGPLGSVQSDGVRLLSDFFNQQRVSNLKKATTFSIAQTAYQMYMTGLQIGQVDIEFHVLPFVFTGVLIDPANQDSSLLNPANSVITTSGLTEVTTSTVQDNSAAAAAAQPITQSPTDQASAIQDFLADPNNTTPSTDGLTSSQLDQTGVTDAQTAVSDAVAANDYAAFRKAVDDRNAAIDLARTQAAAGKRTDVGRGLDSALRDKDSEPKAPVLFLDQAKAVSQKNSEKLGLTTATSTSTLSINDLLKVPVSNEPSISAR